MSTENCLCKFVLPAMLSLLIALATVSAQDYGNDPVLGYYCRNAGNVLSEKYAFQEGYRLQFKATAYLADLNSAGGVERIDSAVQVFYYSNGRVDSSSTVIEGPGRLKDWDLSFPNVFTQPYFFNFYPNDTGGAELAIGFDTDSTHNDLPTGLAEIDRETNRLKLLYLHYPHRPDYRNFSLSFRVIEIDSVILADSVVELGAHMGILMPEYYRKTTIVTDIHVTE
ncbi:MAG TPA: hypothetical protein PLF13_12935 [candidate division Zixibacteria bacterium]|nr:hypothetical protein [candidate division Zixibacteria bacterium]